MQTTPSRSVRKKGDKKSLFVISLSRDERSAELAPTEHPPKRRAKRQRKMPKKKVVLEPRVSLEKQKLFLFSLKQEERQVLL